MNPFFDEIANKDNEGVFDNIPSKPVAEEEDYSAYPDTEDSDVAESSPLSDMSFDEMLSQKDITNVHPKDLAMLGKAPQVGPSMLDSVGPQPDATPLSDEEIDSQRKQLDTEVKIEDMQSEGYDEGFVSALMDVENGVKKGFSDGMWRPHESWEGGNKTLAYGHKLTDTEKKTGTVTINGEKVNLSQGISEAQARTLLKEDMVKAEKRLKRDIKGYEELPERYKNVLINLAFNVGTVKEEKGANGWPKMFKAMRKGDDAEVRKQMVSGFTDKSGNWQRLETRAKKIADSQGLGSGNPMPLGLPPEQPMLAANQGVLGTSSILGR